SGPALNSRIRWAGGASSAMLRIRTSSVGPGFGFVAPAAAVLPLVTVVAMLIGLPAGFGGAGAGRAEKKTAGRRRRSFRIRFPAYCERVPDSSRLAQEKPKNQK